MPRKHPLFCADLTRSHPEHRWFEYVRLPNGASPPHPIDEKAAGDRRLGARIGILFVTLASLWTSGLIVAVMLMRP